MAEQTETAVAETQVQDNETTQTEEENTLLNSDQDDGNTVTEHHDDDDDDPVDNVEPDDAEVAGTTGVDEAVDTDDAEVSDTENVANPDTVDDTSSEATADQAANSEDDSQEAEGEEETEQPIEPFTKIVFLIRPGMSTIGIQRNGTDPEFQSVTSGELEDVLAAAPQAYSKAIEKWNKAPKRKSAKPVQRTIKAATLAPAKTKKAKDETSNLKLF